MARETSLIFEVGATTWIVFRNRNPARTLTGIAYTVTTCQVRYRHRHKKLGSGLLNIFIPSNKLKPSAWYRRCLIELAQCTSRGRNRMEHLNDIWHFSATDCLLTAGGWLVTGHHWLTALPLQQQWMEYRLGWTPTCRERQLVMNSYIYISIYS